MSSGDRMLKLDMSLLMSEINNVVNRHVSIAVLGLNMSRIKEDIAKCSEKTHQLEIELTCMIKDDSSKRTHTQETTHQIGMSLLEQEITSYRDKMHGMQKELQQLCQSHKKYDTQRVDDTPTDNIMLNIQELPVQVPATDNVLDPLEVSDENDQLVMKANEIMSGIHATDRPSLVEPEVVGDDEIYEIMPEEEEEEEEEEGVFEIDVGGVSYYTTGEENGSLYSIDVNGDPDVYVGRLQDGKAVLGSE